MVIRADIVTAGLLVEAPKPRLGMVKMGLRGRESHRRLRICLRLCVQQKIKNKSNARHISSSHILKKGNICASGIDGDGNWETPSVFDNILRRSGRIVWNWHANEAELSIPHLKRGYVSRIDYLHRRRVIQRDSMN